MPVSVLAGVLFVVNVAGRLIAKQVTEDDTTITVGLLTMGAVGVAMAVAGVLWSRRYPPVQYSGELLLAATVGGLLSLLVGPFVVGSQPLAEGVPVLLRELLMFAAIVAAGTLVGVLGTMAAGQDWKSRAWKRYTQRVQSKPRRVVRR
jgi:hypothetical protein